MWKQLLMITGLCIGVLTVANAQDALGQDTLKWDLQTCLDYAKKNNITINTLRWDERSTEQDLLQSKAARLPSLSGNIRHTMMNSKNADPVVGGFQTQANFSGNYGLSSSWTVYNGGFLNNDVKQKGVLMNMA